MRRAMLEALPTADWVIMAAAVADVKPADCALEKLPKQDLPALLPLEPVPDILTELAQQKQPHQKLIGFAAQTGDIVTPAQQKLATKKLDAIAANPIDQPGSGFGSDHNQAVFLDRRGRQVRIPSTNKLLMAHQLYDFVQSLDAKAL
jgi:phosphopantothenoylcysteine decarboxylase/phosphopantothenate--cysteine ligase